MCPRAEIRTNHAAAWLLMGVIICSGCWEPAQLKTPGQAEFSEGSQSFMAGKMPDAIARFDEALRENPRHVKAAYYRAVAREKSGEPPRDAIADLTAVLRLQEEVVGLHDPDSVPLDDELPKLLCARGDLYNRMANYDQAIEDFTAALGEDARCAAAYRGRGIAFMRKGFPYVAIDNLSEAIRLDPDNVEALCARAVANLSLGNRSLDASEDCVHALRVDPNCADAYYDLGCANATVNHPNYAQAIAAYEQSYRLQPDLAAQAKPRIAAAYGQWANKLQKEGDTRAANEMLAQALAADPTLANRGEVANDRTRPAGAGPQQYAVNMPIAGGANAGADVARWDRDGDDFLAHDRFADAIAAYTSALQIDPLDDRALYGRGVAFMKSGFPNTALDDFNTLIESHKNAAQAYCQRSLAHTMLGDYFQGVQDSTEAMRGEPGLALAYYCRAIAYLNQNTYHRAALDLAEAVRLDPTGAERPPASCLKQAFHGNTVRLLRDDQWTEAIDGLRDAIRLVPRWRDYLVPDLAAAYRGRGLQRANEQSYALAIRDFTSAADLTPTVAKNYQARGLTYFSAGDWNRAVDDFRLAIKLDPDMAYELRQPLNDALRRLALPSVRAKSP